MLNILHAIPSIGLQHGGPSQSVAGLVTAMAQQATGRVDLICGRDPQEPAVPGLSARHDIGYVTRRFWCPDPRSIARMAHAARRADVVHVHSYWNGFASLMIAMARRAGTPVVLSPRGSLHSRAMAQSSSRAKAAYSAVVGRRQLAGVSGYHFQTQAEAQASFGADDRPMIVIDNGVQIPQQTTPGAILRAHLFGRTASDLNLVFLGRIARIKGIDLQLEALRLLQHQGVTAHLHLVGPDGGDQRRLQHLSSALGVATCVHTHGPIYSEDKHSWLRAADAVLMSSEFENNSNAALEVMAAGGVLIGTEGSIPDGPVAAGAALRVPRRAGDLAQVLSQHPPLGLRDTTRAYVRQHHAWQPRAARMLDFYESLI